MSAAIRRHRRRASPQRQLAYAAAGLITAFMLFPLYLIGVAALQPRTAVFDYPRALYPSPFSIESVAFFLSATGILPALGRSLLIGVMTVVLALALGCPAGYAIARYRFAGRDLVQLLIVSVRAFPILILAIPLAVTFINWNLYDSVLSVALVHTVMALPLTILLAASVFLRIPSELEEAAMSMGTSRFGAVWRIVLPLSRPGLGAAALFAFVLSWNEVFAAAVLTVRNPTLPAQIVGALGQSPLPFRFAGGLALTLPALVFIFFMRPYLFSAFGQARR
ncbi:MAG: carbohydrate ABC transporter permease [Candidatus Dormibacter sp.]|uniref:carbohydrate ABC transporter permease n=1 Tax=Candidatus Dormibacter sp. TaxID=2973982 RepID=UPI000DB15DBB|nr:MAG: sugar ABC transporter permease [Candidatus Dormibacteraeota bacterium]